MLATAGGVLASVQGVAFAKGRRTVTSRRSRPPTPRRASPCNLFGDHRRLQQVHPPEAPEQRLLPARPRTTRRTTRSFLAKRAGQQDPDGAEVRDPGQRRQDRSVAAQHRRRAGDRVRRGLSRRREHVQLGRPALSPRRSPPTRRRTSASSMPPPAATASCRRCPAPPRSRRPSRSSSRSWADRPLGRSSRPEPCGAAPAEAAPRSHARGGPAAVAAPRPGPPRLQAGHAGAAAPLHQIT